MMIFPQRVHPVLPFAPLDVMLNHFSSAAPTGAYPAELRVLHFVSADSNEIQRIFHCYLVLLLGMFAHSQFLSFIVPW
ncbi:hypothetical protein [Paraglaciecola sp. T6c]|uniref:hypothetical protein n=1 Tax=Pseudoalteromonas atlantica (strain T6c / ATCC BAA-1087) TaxID=3042615 RepID=UPI000305AED6|nr:hypothetical protein [Paraglaciecola sp. T6c]